MIHHKHVYPVPQVLDEDSRTGLWHWLRYHWVRNRPSPTGFICKVEMCAYATAHGSSMCPRHRKLENDRLRELVRKVNMKSDPPTA